MEQLGWVLRFGMGSGGYSHFFPKTKLNSFFLKDARMVIKDGIIIKHPNDDMINRNGVLLRREVNDLMSVMEIGPEWQRPNDIRFMKHPVEPFVTITKTCICIGAPSRNCEVHK
jgi:hypothetical protein